jgi:glycerol transport system permease protein
MRKTSDNRAWLLIIPALTLILICAAVPLITMVNYSVQDVFAGDQFVWLGTDWFESILRSADFWQSLGRSLLYSAIVLAIEIPLGIYIALKMPRNEWLAGLCILLLAIPLLTPWIVVGFTWKVLVDTQSGLYGVLAASLGFNWDLNDTIIAWLTIVIMDIWHWSSLIALLCFAGLKSIPRVHYQAASIDGASRFGIFRYVELPHLHRVILVATLLRFMDSFMVYIEPYVVTRGGPGTSTTFLSLDLVQTASIQFDLGEAGAMSVIYFLIVITVCWALYRAMMKPQLATGDIR